MDFKVDNVSSNLSSPTPPNNWYRLTEAMKWTVPKETLTTGFLQWIDRYKMRAMHYRSTFRYNRRWIKNILIAILAFGMATPRPPIMGLAEGTSFLLIVGAFILAPSYPFAYLTLMLIVSIIALMVGGLLCAGVWASIASANVIYPGSNVYAYVWMAWMIGTAWLFFLPIPKYGMFALAFAANSAGCAFLTVELSKSFPDLKPGFNVWLIFTSVIPWGLVNIASAWVISFCFFGPESDLERARDAEVDLLYTMKRWWTVQISAETNCLPPKELLDRFGEMDVYVAKRRKFVPPGQPFTLHEYGHLERVAKYEYQEALSHLRMAKIELFVFGVDNPWLVEKLMGQVSSIFQIGTSLSLGARLRLGLKEVMGLPSVIDGKFEESKEEMEDAAVLWNFVGLVLDGFDRLIDVLEPGKKGVKLDDGLIARLQGELDKLADFILHIPVVNVEEDVDGGQNALNTTRQLFLTDAFSFGEYLLDTLKTAEKVVEARGKWKFWTPPGLFKKKVAAGKQPLRSLNVDQPEVHGKALEQVKLDERIEKKSVWGNFLNFWSSDAVSLGNLMAVNIVILMVWAVVPGITGFYVSSKGWWSVFPMMYTVSADSLGASITRGFWRFMAACLSCVVSILATLPDYGTNSWSVAIWGILLFSFYGWIAAFAPEFIDVTTVGGFTYMYVTWAYFGVEKPNPETYVAGKFAGERLVWVAIGILLGLLSYLVGRPKYARGRVRQRFSKVLMDVQELLKVFIGYAHDPSKFYGDVNHDEMFASLKKAMLDVQSARADLTLAKTEPNVVHPWSSTMYEEVQQNLVGCVSRMTSIYNLYRWMSTRHNLTEVAANPNPAFFGPGKVEKLEDWCRILAMGMEGTRIEGQGEEMKHLIWEMIKDTNQFRRDLTSGVVTEESSVEGRELIGKLKPEELAIRARMNNVVSLLAGILSVHLGVIEGDILALNAAGSVATVGKRKKGA